MTGSKLQAQHDREDFEHSQASKRRKRRKSVAFILLGSIALIYPIATMWVMS